VEVHLDWDGPEISGIVDRALAEDIGTGDITTSVLVTDPPVLTAHFLAKQDGILAGIPLLSRIFRRLDPAIVFDANHQDGEAVTSGTVIGRIKGRADALLAGERLALNLLQRLSGIATKTSIYAGLASPFKIRVMDTRKTTPLLRSLEKYAVTMGGGFNHRAGLFDGILVKDNHLKLQPDFHKVLEAFMNKGYPADKIEVEVTSLEMLKAAMKAGIRWFLLDNMRPTIIRKCVKIKRGNMTYEVSGGITSRNFVKYLIRGVDAISIGGLTHSARSLDISMEMD
jgi:nicotinate-nucleotide pyrophosphorylase (carboxylating)